MVQPQKKDPIPVHRKTHELRNELVEELILIGGAKVVQNETVIP
jgi:hypothetical protein